MKKMIIACYMCSVLWACDSPSPTSNNSQPAQTSVTNSSSNAVSKSAENQTTEQSPYYAKRPLENSWPAGNQDDDAVELADNLLAANYMIVLDGSGSMRETKCAVESNKMYEAKQAVNAFAEQIPADANLGLYVFDAQGKSVRMPLNSGGRDEFKSAVSNIAAAGGTPLSTAITKSYKSLLAQAKKQLGYGEYHLVVVTDGRANKNENPSFIVEKILGESPVVIHTIGFCIRGGHSLNQAGLIDYKPADDPESLRQSLQAVLAEAPDFTQDSFQR